MSTTSKKRPTLALLLSVLALYCCSVHAQRRRPSTPKPVATSRVDYSRFKHSTKQHQAACNTCHLAPTSNWQRVREFPDVADFPDHEACVRCHRAQFFKSAQPIICSDCHAKTSPRDDVRFAFRNPARGTQFRIEFPHDRHQDVIARLGADRESHVQSHHGLNPVSPAVEYNNCAVCHATNKQALKIPPAGWNDSFAPVPDAFKTVPRSHASCFNCHWKGQAPTKDSCGDCHKLDPAVAARTSPVRISMKFKHDGGGDKQAHVAECTTCHINITKSATLRGLKPDVPITGCTECHNKSGLREDLARELTALDKNREFVCTYCHTSDIGRRDPPPGHYLVAERKPLLRKDLK